MKLILKINSLLMKRQQAQYFDPHSPLESNSFHRLTQNSRDHNFDILKGNKG